jgi:hypothetical protein
MRKRCRNFWAKVLLILSVSELDTPPKQPIILTRPIKAQQTVMSGTQDQPALDHTHLESPEPESQEHPPLSIAPPPTRVPFVQNDDSWQVPLFATHTQRNQQYLYGCFEGYVPSPMA